MSNDNDDDDLLFLKDDAEEESPEHDRWVVLIVDDDQSVHDATELSLEHESFDGTGVRLLHAFSAKEGAKILKENPDVAVILLDVIMEDDEAGLRLAKFIREDSNNKAIRIILRTGQPGMAPEAEIFDKYDIHDYKEKSELTSNKLKNAVLSGIRSYRDIAKEIAQHQHQANLFMALTQLSRGSIDVHACLRDFSDNIRKIFDAPICLVYEIELQTQNICQFFWSAEEDHSFQAFIDAKQNIPFTDKAGIVYKAWASKETVTLSPANQQPSIELLTEHSKEVLMVIALPILKENHVAAIFEIFLINDDPEYQKHLNVVQAACNQLGVILERLEYEDKIQRRVTELESTLDFLKSSQQQLLTQGTDTPQPSSSSDKGVPLEDTFDSMMHQLDELSKELMQVQLRLHGTISAMPSIIIGLKQDGTITDWNNQAEKIIGVASKKAIEHKLQEISPELSIYLEDIEKAISEGTQTIKEKLVNLFPNIRSEEDLQHYYDLMIYPVQSDVYHGAVLRIDDVTERHKLQEIMAQNEKMISVGGLASGVAHELNNPLGAISQNTQNILRRIDQSLPANIKEAEKLELDIEKLRSYLQARKIIDFVDSIQKSSERAAYIASNLLQFSRRRKSVKSAHPFSEMIENSIQLAANDANVRKKINFKDIEINKEFANNLPPVYCHMIEIEQVLLNLIKNAAQAMGDVSDRKHALHFKLYLDGDFVTAELTDTGPGIPKESLASIFEPFFTTKPLGEGTGLGLSVSYGIIVENHKGKMSVKSEVGQGTTFYISLPIKTSDDPDI